ncbi:DUF6891 domain-containing protein [Barrientosiimonas endolithica]|uniref:DUF6891 domain-containing protein n=1 Tax=Barrientosiimonas endolithica TaxID=1535208 RepID=UPI00259B2C58|nr:hypothetical protein [Barrientosiimonas endolithica]
MRPQPGSSLGTGDSDDEFTEEELTEAVRESLLPGFFDEDEVIERVADAYDLADDDPRLLETVERVVDEHEQRIASGRGPSDYDRLAAAFRQLEQEGVVARMNFTCCSSCGFTEIDDERTPLDRVINGEYRYLERSSCSSTIRTRSAWSIRRRCSIWVMARSFGSRPTSTSRPGDTSHRCWSSTASTSTGTATCRRASACRSATGASRCPSDRGGGQRASR